jgi:ABC-2 type transport system ATP-binding protein
VTAAQPVALSVDQLVHRYGDRTALAGVSFEVAPHEVFGLLGPNGGGKTTLFRIVSTLLTPTAGRVCVFGDDVVRAPARVRARLGVVFQSPAIDTRLTVRENLWHHGHLYGRRGRALAARIDEVLARLRLEDRADEFAGRLSGGLQRRTELAKAFLHAPRLLVLDEPTTGLDPGARRDVWEHLEQIRRDEGTTILLTTHLMDEGARADRVAILHRGRLVAVGTPDALTSAIGGDVVLVGTRDAVTLAARIHDRFGLDAEPEDGRVRMERPRAHEFVPELVETFPGEIDTVTVGKPTLDDVFAHYTGRRLEGSDRP